MTKRICTAALLVMLALLTLGEARIHGKPSRRSAHAAKTVRSTHTAVAHKPTRAQSIVAGVVRMLVSLKTASRSAFDRIEALYQKLRPQMAFKDRAALQEGLDATKVLVPLPADPERYNIRPRLTGIARIAEKDPDNVRLYLAARPFVIGCMLEVASRVKSGPLDVTALVRSEEYQVLLAGTNKNAVTRFPAHTLAIAFDIGLLNTPANTVREIKQVLDQMVAEDKILYVAEVRQISFHIVPLPQSEAYFTKVYTDNVALAATE